MSESPRPEVQPVRTKHLLILGEHIFKMIQLNLNDVYIWTYVEIISIILYL